MNIAVLGAGAWGTAIAVALSSRHAVVLYARCAEDCSGLARDRVNARYLPSLPLPELLRVTDDLKVAGNHAAAHGLTLIATPTDALRSVVRRVADIAPDVPLVWLCKASNKPASNCRIRLCTRNWAIAKMSGRWRGQVLQSKSRVACRQR